VSSGRKNTSSPIEKGLRDEKGIRRRPQVEKGFFRRWSPDGSGCAQHRPRGGTCRQGRGAAA